jgi:hypothetical protein
MGVMVDIHRSTGTPVRLLAAKEENVFSPTPILSLHKPMAGMVVWEDRRLPVGEARVVPRELRLQGVRVSPVRREQTEPGMVRWALEAVAELVE